jgi:tRNA(Arg) A34 adenosine deaminase TadA
MNQVISNARKSKSIFFSAIVKGDAIVSMSNGHGDKNPIEHAEILTIKKALKKIGVNSLKKCTLYSTCEPCIMCMGAIHWSGIREVTFGARLTDSKRFGFNEIIIPGVEKAIKTSGVKLNKDIMRKECLELFNQNK